MKTFVALSASLLFISLAHAQQPTQEDDSTQTLYTACKQVREGSRSWADFNECSRLIGFIDGYKFGAIHGAATAFLKDPQNLATTNGVDDFTHRLGAVGTQAACIPERATRAQVRDVFITYVDEHPEALKASYANTLAAAIQNHYCP